MNPKHSIYLGFVGSFRKWQGLETLFEAIKIVKGKISDPLMYVLVGDGEQMKCLKEILKRNGLQREVIFTGRVRYEEVPTILNTFDFCLAPFREERNMKIGLSPLKLYEYLACGKPVIASRVEGVIEIVENGNCGYLFEPDDVEDLASRIIESFKESDRLPEMGNNRRALVKRSFSWEEIGRRVESVLREALETSSKN